MKAKPTTKHKKPEKPQASGLSANPKLSEIIRWAEQLGCVVELHIVSNRNEYKVAGPSDDKLASQRSGALYFQDDDYPKAWNGRVPSKVRLLVNVHSELPFDDQPQIQLPGSICLYANSEFDVVVNSHGAMFAVTDSCQLLGLKPGEFEVIQWH